METKVSIAFNRARGNHPKSFTADHPPWRSSTSIPKKPPPRWPELSVPSRSESTNSH
jgi:hypothetical protein